ncbi:hypothetical protein PtrSN002B_008682 [Pyrenophora tritici-repentis]|nr:hypothetical protein PtrV1_10361 [Pyrenophora tritici-repentis]KAI1529869.1 hypothetical protein PtrSN001A_008394 [Pyrenophora tritici-repentis]KAI1530669.1 hypothetical protein PtrSN001C_008595 [Pyrenophora tritici-repentis]KAI1540439.1 hypothetical protein PtrSN002B_008682 [Pyrenophora tritici-repentis]KAI1564196.1 hypothetical protein PtrEW4_008996 [Pyrenophora tritici-repentis]
MVTGEGSSATISCTHIPEPKRSYSDRNRELDDAYYDHISQENQLLSPLLSLPAEMREIIYDYSIDNEVMIYPTGIIGQKGKISALLWVCRQTRAETAKQFFSKTKFETETLDKLAAFAQCLEKNHRKELRTISLLPRAGWDLVDFIDNVREYQAWSCALPVPTKLSEFPALEKVIIMSTGRHWEFNITERCFFGFYLPLLSPHPESLGARPVWCSLTSSI